MTSSAIFLLTLLLAGARTEELATPSNLLGPQNFNHHPFEAGQHLKELTQPQPTKKGPVLFPNDAPSARRPPLVVTSRPLLESIARSELNPNPPDNSQNNQDIETYNSIAEQSQLNRVQFKPGFLTSKRYQNFHYDPPSYVTPNPIGPTPVILVNAVTGKPVPFPGDYEDYPADYKSPYAGVKKVGLLNQGFGGDNKFTDYEEKVNLPPIFKALSDHAKQSALKLKLKNAAEKYKHFEVKEPDHSNQYQSNRLDDELGDYSQNSNYAFSYKVKDQKTGDDFSHSQQSTGSATNGEYRVRLPDGRMQIVSYTADENGYKADVKYDDEDKTTGNTINNDYGYTNNDEKPTYDYNNSPKHSDYRDQNYNVAATVETQQQNYDYISNVYNRGPINYRRYKVTPAPVKEEDESQYPDVKDYDTQDYSLEYSGKNTNFPPHKSKFSVLAETRDQDDKVKVLVIPNREDKNQQPNLKPSIEELRRLFLNKEPINSSPDNFNIVPIEINVPSTTPRQHQYETTTEHVVLIGGSTKPNLYTNIRSSVAPQMTTPSPFYFSTPSNFLGSAVAPLTKNIDFSGPKPVLSSRFIDRINRYLTY